MNVFRILMGLWRALAALQDTEFRERLFDLFRALRRVAQSTQWTESDDRFTDWLFHRAVGAAPDLGETPQLSESLLDLLQAFAALVRYRPGDGDDPTVDVLEGFEGLIEGARSGRLAPADGIDG